MSKLQYLEENVFPIVVLHNVYVELPVAGVEENFFFK